MKSAILLFLAILMASFAPVLAAGGQGPEAAYPELADGSTQYAAFPKPVEKYETVDGGLIETLKSWQERETPIPAWVTGVHLGFLAWTVYTAHYPVLFVGGFLFFLAGLVIHGGVQGWWIAPIIQTLPDQALMLGATILTAFNDNAAITYLASQVDGISFTAKQAVVAGAVTGGGLTVIANAPNPAGQSILSRYFEGGVSPLKLFLGALIPTIVMYLCFVILPNGPAHKAAIERSGVEHPEKTKPDGVGDIPQAPAIAE